MSAVRKHPCCVHAVLSECCQTAPVLRACGVTRTYNCAAIIKPEAFERLSEVLAAIDACCRTMCWRSRNRFPRIAGGKGGLPREKSRTEASAPRHSVSVCLISRHRIAPGKALPAQEKLAFPASHGSNQIIHRCAPPHDTYSVLPEADSTMNTGLRVRAAGFWRLARVCLV